MAEDSIDSQVSTSDDGTFEQYHRMSLLRIDLFRVSDLSSTRFHSISSIGPCLGSMDHWPRGPVPSSNLNVFAVITSAVISLGGSLSAAIRPTQARHKRATTPQRLRK